MRLRHQSRTQAQFLTAITAIALLLTAVSLNFAQDKGQFKAGDRVEVDLNMSGNPNSEYATWRKATVVKVEMWQGSVAGYHLKTDDGRDIVSSARHMRALGKEEQSPPNAQPNEPRKDNEPPIADPPAKDQKPTTGLKFKVGDRVKASPAMLKEDKYYQPCTITKVMPPNAYAMRCDPFNGISFEDFTVREDFIRPWSNATPAPTFDCSLDQPAAVNLKTSPASAAVFKRIIYEWQAVSNSKTKVGVTFETFRIGTPFKNTYARNKNALLYEGFPQNATIYPIKTRFVTCVEGNEYNYRTVWESGYACAKNRFGEWSCGVDGGAPRMLDKQNVPKKVD
jgi:hypothetical protein